MIKHGALLVAVLVATQPVLAAPSLAQQVVVADSSGDTVRRGLDITEATLRNRDHDVISDVTFSTEGNGSVVVAVKPRGGPGYRLVTIHRVHAPDDTYMLHGFRGPPGPVRCTRLTSKWDASSKTMRMRMPSTCMNDGNYGAVKSWVVSEGPDGFADFAPDTAGQPFEFTEWIPRG